MNNRCIPFVLFFMMQYSMQALCVQSVFYQHLDMLGSVVSVSDKDGKVISQSNYEPFGRRLEGNTEGIGYTGHSHDAEQNLTYMKARYYNPAIGRFYSNDPVDFVEQIQRGNSHAHGFNRYAYVNNNPYKYTDPDGEFLDLFMDVGFILFDLGDMAINGINDTNSASLAANVAGALIPGATGLGLTARAGKAAKKSCCFVAGTQVLTEHGYKNIEDVKQGEKLWAKNTETGEQDWKPVTKIFVEPDRGIYEIKLIGSNGVGQEIQATDDHPFYVIDKGWRKTIDLVANDLIETDGYGSMKVVYVRDEQRTELTYNFTVADFHTYYVTKKNVLVHNCGKTQLPDSKIVEQDGVTVEHYYKGNDHAPAHAHVNGGGKKTKIGQNGKPIKGSPELTSRQRKVIEANKSKIRRSIGKIGKVLQDREENL